MKYWSIKNPLLWSTLVLLLILIFYALHSKGYLNPNERIFVYRLPKDSSPPVFGPKTWRALHDIVENIPCPSCRGEATSFMKFFHDYVNKKLKKEIKFPDNYNEWLDKLCKTNSNAGSNSRN